MEKEHTNTPMAVRPEQAARMIGVGRTKVFELIAAGEIRAFYVGRARLIDVADLRRFLDARKQAAA
ncbi:MAG TPA: helix-turn-helix domain-containing protein [Vulgatibacter sp.]|nr:helix-turn-helix domain-containing protein [Vulgatibacter sp.]